MNAMDVALICKALGDANRLEIVQMLSDGSRGPSMASAFNAQSDPDVVFKSFSASNSQCGAYSQQRYKHQYCCAWDCILQILFSSYQISLSLNQSFVAKIRSISISSPCHFYFVLYCFIGFSWSPLPLFVPLRSVQSQRPLDVVNRSAQSRCPPDLLWSSLRYGRCKADIHRMSCTLVFSLIRIRKSIWEDIT